MSKRSQPDSDRSDNQPPAKKTRYNYNHPSQHINGANARQNLLLSTRKPIAINSNIQIDSEIPKPDEFCPLNWFTQRLHNSDVNGFFDILPYPETDGIFKKLLQYNNGSISLTNNLINTLDTMQKITQEIHERTQNSSSKLINNKRQKKQFVNKQNEIFNTINIQQLQSNHQNNIHKTQQIIHKYNNISNDYKSFENERELIWKSLSNSNKSVTPIPIENKMDKPTDNIIEMSDFISSTDHESDEDFLPHQKQNKKRQKKRKKKKKQKVKLRENDVGKNPNRNHEKDMDPIRWWNKFAGYVEPQHPDDLHAIIPHLQSDVFPTKIPLLPFEKTFNMYNNFGFDNFNQNDNHSTSVSVVDPIDNELYFAELPKHYEYFLDKKCYIDEQLKIESNKTNKYLNGQPLHKNYPLSSLYSHSFDQRVLSAIVHECDGLSYMEGDINENKWRKIGTEKVVEAGRRDYETLKAKKNKTKVDVERLQKHAYKPVDMIEPVVKYSTSVRNNSRKIISFEQALRNEICKYVYDGDWNEINKIANMSWNQRQDDECCTVIKSLDGVLEQMCYDKELNSIDTNVKIGKEIVDIMQHGYQRNKNNFDAWTDFKSHVDEIENSHHDNGFIVDQETLNRPECRNYFQQKQSLSVDKAIEAVKQKRFVQTKSDVKDP